MLSFRPLMSTDFPTLLAWLSTDHIKQWWDDGDDTLEKVAQHYGSSETDVHRFVLIKSSQERSIPIGYFQYYFVSSEVVGIDQFIGKIEDIDKGIGTKAVRLFIKHIVLKHRPRMVILDPHPNNRRAIRCYEKVGFAHYSTKTTKDGKRAYWMRLNCRAFSEANTPG